MRTDTNTVRHELHEKNESTGDTDARTWIRGSVGGEGRH